MLEITRNILAHAPTAGARALFRCPRGTTQVVVTPEEDVMARIGGDAVAAAANLGARCAAGVPTAIPAWEGARLSLLGITTAGDVGVEVYGRVRGDSTITSGRDQLAGLAPDMDFDFEHIAPFVNASGQMHVRSRLSGSAAQTTSANVPADAAINRRQALAFDGTNDVLAAATDFGALSNAVTSFALAAVVEVAAAPADQRAAVRFSNNSTGTRFEIGLDENLAPFLGGRVLDADTEGQVVGAGQEIFLGRAAVLVGLFDCAGGTLSMWVDGRKVIDAAAWPNVTAGDVSATASASVSIGAANLAAKLGAACAWANPGASFDGKRVSGALGKIWGVSTAV